MTATDVKRIKVSHTGPHGPYKAYVTVEALRTHGGRHTMLQGAQFEVSVSWWGPPPFAFPPDRNPGQRSDVYIVGPELELAKALAIDLEDYFRDAWDEPPELREMVDRHRRRN